MEQNVKMKLLLIRDFRPIKTDWIPSRQQHL